MIRDYHYIDHWYINLSCLHFLSTSGSSRRNLLGGNGTAWGGLVQPLESSRCFLGNNHCPSLRLNMNVHNLEQSGSNVMFQLPSLGFTCATAMYHFMPGLGKGEISWIFWCVWFPFRYHFLTISPFSWGKWSSTIHKIEILGFSCRFSGTKPISLSLYAEKWGPRSVDAPLWPAWCMNIYALVLLYIYMDISRYFQIHKHVCTSIISVYVYIHIYLFTYSFIYWLFCLLLLVLLFLVWPLYVYKYSYWFICFSICSIYPGDSYHPPAVGQIFMLPALQIMEVS